jgi:hypothetical protein
MQTGTVLSDRIKEKWPDRKVRAADPRNPGRFYDELNVGPCLLISRELGAGGCQIVINVAKWLGWAHLDTGLRCSIDLRRS